MPPRKSVESGKQMSMMAFIKKKPVAETQPAPSSGVGVEPPPPVQKAEEVPVPAPGNAPTPLSVVPNSIEATLESLKRPRDDEDDDDMPARRRPRKSVVPDDDEEMTSITQKEESWQEQPTQVSSSGLGRFDFNEDKSYFLQDDRSKIPTFEKESTDYISRADPAVKKQFTQNHADDSTKDLNSMKHESKGDNISPFVAELQFFYHTTSCDSYYPSWMQPDKIMDADKRPITHPDYDQTTLWVPSREDVVKRAKGKSDESWQRKDEKLFSPMFTQYWEVKAKHMDSIVMFKVGKFYEIFFYDAAICNRVCDLAWMRAKMEPHVGFPEAALPKRAQMLVDHGYKVIVVEQVETVEEAQKRTGKQTVTLKRDVCQVMTSGTVMDSNMIGDKAEAQFMMSVAFDEDTYSF